MPEIPNVIPGAPVESGWGNTIRDRVASRYADATDRLASDPLPAAGQITWLDDPGQLDLFDGTDWVPLILADGTVAMTGPLDLDSQDLNNARIIRSSAFEVEVFVGGFQAMRMQGAGGLLGMQNVFDSTDGAAENVNVNSNGFLRRSTSARRYKSDIRDATDLVDIVLQPVTFHHDESGQDYLGFIADDIADQLPIAGVFHDGLIENYDQRAVIAILAAKVNSLTERLDRLEGTPDA